MIGLPFPIHPPGRAARTCPLGLRFVDAATGATVVEGLRAMTWAGSAGNRKADTRLIAAVTNRGGIQVFHGLPGLQVFEHSADDDRWQTLAPASYRDFPIEVTDFQRRYLPATFVVSAPSEGLVSLTGGGSPTWVGAGLIPLFSSVSRPAPPGVAVVSAELHQAATGDVAAWALAEISFEHQGDIRIVRGLADDEGRLVVMFAYPEGPRRSAGGSPPANTRGLARQEWAITVRFFHDPSAPVGEFADYARCLSQPAALAHRPGSPLQPVGPEPLHFGAELNLGRLELIPA